jgi:Asp-tRNA(Asn)/Glu-tRNA(Gln) amidotransferase A subunit family amidase|tara:strand:+ start:1999 stop:3294 length:1296 start_codon:yes stop_codon:yes gene_type:complete
MTMTNVVDLAASIRRGDENAMLDCLDALKTHFEKREPDVLAFVPQNRRFKRLRREARALLAQYPDPAERPALFGVPVGVKDIFHVDGFVTRAGSEVPAELLQGTEAESVRRLKAAGALIMGKTVTTEFAYFAPGPTRNPHNPAHTPGGSSSGSAAAVAAELCPLALGTQTIGSVTRPAAFCGVVGYKPTYERISRAGVIPLSPSVDHIGPFARDVAGMALVAAVLVEGWNTAAAASQPARARLGVPVGDYLQRSTAKGRAHFRATCDRLATAGFEIRSVVAMPDFDAIYARHNLLVAAETAQVHAQWFAQYGESYHQKTADLIQHGQTVSRADLAVALNGREQLRGELTALMEANQIDIWISPSAPGAAPQGLDSTGDPVMNLPWTHSGLPTIGLPSGAAAGGLPFGLQLAARFGADEMLFAWATEIEKAV